MRVQMRAQIAGTRDGVLWPEVGAEITVPDAEGAQLCASGHATPVVTEPKVERAVVPAVEKRGVRKPRAKS